MSNKSGLLQFAATPITQIKNREKHEASVDGKKFSQNLKHQHLKIKCLKQMRNTNPVK